MRNATNIFRIAVLSAILLLGGVAPVFAQQILATFGMGDNSWTDSPQPEGGLG